MDIEKRIELLEKKLRLHRRLGLAAASALALSLALGAAGDRTIEARKFILRDAAGRPVGIWEGAEGGPLFVMTDGGQGKLGLTIGEEGPGLTMTDSRGRTRLQAAVVKKLGDVPGLTLMDENGKTQVLLAAKDRTTSLLTFEDTSGGGKLNMGVVKGNPIVSQRDSAGKLRTTWRLDEKGSPSLSFSDEKDQTRVSVTLYEGRNPAYSLLDEAGNIRASLSLLENGRPWIVFVDDKEKITWSVPPASEIK